MTSEPFECASLCQSLKTALFLHNYSILDDYQQSYDIYIGMLRIVIDIVIILVLDV